MQHFFHKMTILLDQLQENTVKYECTLSLHIYVNIHKLEVVNNLVGGVAQWWNVGLWLANFPCSELEL